jgi:DNA-binding MarR family transcriptional regulator
MARSAKRLTAADGFEAEEAIDLSPLSGLIGYRLRRAQVAVFQDFHRAFQAVDIRPVQFGILSLIDRNPGLKQSEVSAALGIKRTNFVPLLDELEQRGLAKREAAQSDRRSYALYLTEAGTALMDELYAINRLHEARLTARIGEAGRTRLLALLEQLTGDAETPEI